MLSRGQISVLIDSWCLIQLVGISDVWARNGILRRELDEYGYIGLEARFDSDDVAVGSYRLLDNLTLLLHFSNKFERLLDLVDNDCALAKLKDAIHLQSINEVHFEFGILDILPHLRLYSSQLFKLLLDKPHAFAFLGGDPVILIDLCLGSAALL